MKLKWKKEKLLKSWIQILLFRIFQKKLSASLSSAAGEDAGTRKANRKSPTTIPLIKIPLNYK